MNNVSRIVKGVVALVAIIAIGVGIGTISSKKPPVSPVPEPLATQAGPGEPNRGSSEFVRSTALTSALPVQPLLTNATLTAPPQNVLTNWEAKLDDILGSDLDEKQKASQLAAILPSLPEEGQEEVAQHLANLVTDEDYSSISGFLTNSALPESVLDVFIADSLNRPNSVKLPLLLEVARNSQNAKAEEAKEILQLFLDEDYGEDWAQWDASLNEWLKNNPD